MIYKFICESYRKSLAQDIDSNESRLHSYLKDEHFNAY